ncbi:MAG: helix-turn-helix domain-containing protein [Solidesulfovibrio sp.]|uniref:helix-turn-helix domain-containing protein n=1 Tax=Solidesulfovibrio sp. TaxID=2910990 RepID=UPI002B205DFF|nr:helix-turn-helix domain-containing protein [Solidesulfovibrio sp.]MEA4857080.1 helix-turn-helix domain-containing protein [Solidesulfovibrio sp.]
MFEEAMERIRNTTGLRTQVQLAACLDIRQSSISDAKRRDNIPDSWLMGLYEKYDLNPVWIKTGQGAVYLMGDPDRTGPAKEPAPLPPPPPEPTVTELKAALEARLGGGLRLVIVGTEDRVEITPVGGGVADGPTSHNHREEVTHV